MSEELKITKERVLSAAGKCGTAEDILRELFPEAFEEAWRDITGSATALDMRPIDNDNGPWIVFGGLDNPYQDVFITGIFGPKNIKLEKGRIWRKVERTLGD